MTDKVKKTEVATQENKPSTYLTKISDRYLPMLTTQLEGYGMELSDYQKQCVLNALSTIHEMLDVKGIKWNDPSLDQNNIGTILMNIATLELNAVAEPREVFFQIRNVAKIEKDEKGKEQKVWKKKIELGIEGDGNDAILARFGRGIKKIYPYWIVRENDVFEYPKFNGLELTPPKWEPKGGGDVVRIVYPIMMNDNTVHYFIGEKSDVVKNLMAHINNNLMNETFGICADRYKATAEQQKQIAAKKKEVMNKAKELGFDVLDDAEFTNYISPSWKEYFSREQMIIRKIRNNITKKIPKDFGSALAQKAYTETTEDVYKYEEPKELKQIDIEPVEFEVVNDADVEIVEGEIIDNNEPKNKVNW